MVEEGNSLNSLTKPHFVGQDSIPVFIPALDEPVETFKLEIFEFSVVFEDGYVFVPVLPGFSLLPHIEAIHLGLHLDDVGVVVAVLLIPDVLVVLQKEFMDLIMNFKLFPDVLDGDLIVGLELLDLLATIKGLLGFPCRIIVADIPPFYVVELIRLSI